MKLRMPVAKEGIPFILIGGLVTFLFILAGMLLPASVFIYITLFIIWFFRDPERETQVKDATILSPADGTVVEVKKIEAEDSPISEKSIKVGIFMSIFNVHVNRIPVTGIIEKITYFPGKFLSADLDKASLNNERNMVIMRNSTGRTIAFVQVAGLIARRIVCKLHEGQTVKIGERFGLIRFGSRVDIYLPEDSELLVSSGDIVRAGKTCIGNLS